MQHRKRRLRPLAHRARGRRCKQRGTQLGSAGKQLGPRINGRSGERRLEKLSNDSEDERALKLATASKKNIDAVGRCKLPRRTQQPRLSNPRRPLDTTSRPSPPRAASNTASSAASSASRSSMTPGTTTLVSSSDTTTSSGIPVEGSERGRFAPGGSRDAVFRQRYFVG